MNSKNYNKNNRKFIQGLRSFKDILPSKVKRLINKKGQIYSEILENWRYFVGNDLFDISFPKSFKNGNKLGSSYLTVMVKRGNEVEIEYSKNKIIDRINSYFGYKVVEKLKLISFDSEINNLKKHELNKKYSTNNKYMNKIINIKNDKIKKSLTELTKFFKKK